MRIRTSIRRYFLAAMLLLGISLSVAFTALAVNYFIQGMDAVLRGTMITAVRQTTVLPGQPVNTFSFHLAARWQDVPEAIKSRFPSPPRQPYQLLKDVKGDFILNEPEYGFFLMMVPAEGGRPIYISKVFTQQEHARYLPLGRHPILWILASGLGAILVFALVLLSVMRGIAAPVERLRDWARQLTPASIQQPPPDFRYSELNTLAEIVHTSLDSVQSGIEREREFLSHASHELRTPISVIRASSALLKRLSPDANTKQKQAMERIDRAGLTMTDLTETLLWMSREQALPPQKQTLDLDELIRQLAEDLSYLLQGKRVHLEITTVPHQLEVAATACRIVLTNLIRNAFQHTSEGTVAIVQNGPQVTITNRERLPETNTENLGFGLGLKLTHKIVEQYGWLVRIDTQADSHSVKVEFYS